MPRVAYDNFAFVYQRFGGVSRYFTELAQRVPQDPAFTTRVVAPLHLNQHLAQAQGVCTFGLYQPRRFRGSDRLNVLAGRLLSPWALRSWRPDVVHRTWYYHGPAPQGCRTVVTVFDLIHELMPDSVSASDQSAVFKRRAVLTADHVICISENTKRDLQRLFDVPDDQISVTHLAASPIFTPGGEQAQAPASGRPFVLYVGHRRGYKGFDRAASAFASSPRLVRDFDLVAFGGPPLGPDERTFLDSLGLRADAVRHASGDDTQLVDHYRRARAFVYPSEYEGFGIPPLEAMGCACPVASSNASSLPEVIGQAAVSFDPLDLGAMRDALEQLCFDDELRTRCIQAGLEQAARFSWDRCARETATAYRSLLAR